MGATNRRIASIDIGTNSVLLLIAERRGRELVALRERASITRLGRGVDATGRLDAEAVDETLGCLQRYHELIRAHGEVRVGAVATSAMRDAAGTGEMLRRAESIIGARPEIISGTREAQLTFAGALSGLTTAEQVAVVDVGGGSTEIVLGRLSSGARSEIEELTSLDLGAVRLTERHVHSDPPGRADIAEMVAAAATVLDRAPPLTGRTLVGVGGTITALAAIELELVRYDAELVHGVQLSASTLDRLARVLSSRNAAQRRALLSMDPRRADVIVAGALLVGELVARAARVPLMVSARGVRWGLAQELARV